MKSSGRRLLYVVWPEMEVAWTTVMGNEGEERWMVDAINGTEVRKQHFRSKTRKCIALSF